MPKATSMKSLKTISSISIPKIPRFTPDHFQSRILSHLYLEFFFEESRFLISPEYKVLTTGQAGEEEIRSAEALIQQSKEQLEKTKLYIIYQLALYSSLLESNSYYISLNNNTVICRLLEIPDHPDEFELKLYTIERRELPSNYKDKIYIGRDFISFSKIERDHFGLKHIRNSLREQLRKTEERFDKNIVKEEDRKNLQSEYLNEVAELIEDFSEQAEALMESTPVTINTSNMKTEELTEINRQFRELKHLLIELEDTLREMEAYMFEQVLARAVRYATKFRKDLTNYINYILLKINGRISDAVNGTHI